MIYYLCTAGATYTIREYVKSWGPVPESRMKCLTYESLKKAGALHPGTYIFTDLERLSPPELELAGYFWSALSGSGLPVRLLNNPSRVKRRYDLLRALSAEGRNRFRVFLAREPFHSLRYPVFIREENDHNGNLTPLIHGPRELANRLLFLKWQGYRARDLLIVEFCDTSDASGIFRKYSAFVIGDEVLPRHLIFSRAWNLKRPDLTEPELVREQEAYLGQNPHREWLKEVFRSAGIEYGRIDYSLLGGEPQVWEINTNPAVKKLTPRITSAFEAIDSAVNSGETIPLKIDSALVRAIEAEERGRRRAALFRRAAGRIYSSRWIRSFIPAAKSLLRSSTRRAAM